MDRALMYATLAQKVELFRGLTPDDVGKIFARGMTVRYMKGETIFSKGTIGNTMYVVLGGSIAVCDGDNLLATLHTGDMFGEMSLISSEPRSATVIAAEDCHLFVLAETTFEHLLTKRVAVRILLNIIRTLCRRLRNANIRTCHGS